MDRDLELAFQLADLADAVTLAAWSSTGVVSRAKPDGSPVTEADVAAERAVFDAVRESARGDGFLGEELGELRGTTGRRWIVDGIDGTRFFAAGLRVWGTLIALECDGEIVLGVASSPAQDRRWWAARGKGAFTRASRRRSRETQIHVSTERGLAPDRFTTLPAYDELSEHDRRVVERLVGGRPSEPSWSVTNQVAEGELDVCVCFGGGIWDHAASSILVEEAGGRFTDHRGRRRLDTHTAIYSNGMRHDEVLAAVTPL